MKDCHCLRGWLSNWLFAKLKSIWKLLWADSNRFKQTTSAWCWIDLSKQQVLDADAKSIHKSNFTENQH